MARRRSFLLTMVLLAAATPVAAEEPARDATTAVDALARRLEELERRNDALAGELKRRDAAMEDLSQRNQSLTEKVEELSRRLDGDPAAGPDPTPSPLPPDSWPSDEPWDGVAADPPAPLDDAPSESRFRVGDYDDELGQYVLVRPRDAQRVPFELRLDLITQARFLNFAPSRNAWVDAAGRTEPVRSLDTVEISRNFLVFSGFAIDPKLQYSTVVFSSTATASTVYMGWINYRFNRTFDLRVGNWLIPGTREWYEPFRWTLGADRLMATTFFRPNISPGVWLQGEPVDGLNYVAMVADSLDRFTQGVATIVGSSVAFGGTLWYEPTDDHGGGVSDVEYHENRSFRFGTNLNIARRANQGFSAAAIHNPEDTLLRLSDGTPLFQPDLFGPGVEVEATNVQLWTVDAAMKHRGLGISGEYFFRWLNAIRTVGGSSPYESLFTTGGLLQAGYFVKPHKLEAFGRTSFVTGRFGGGVEYGGGLNWYPRGARTWRTTFEVLRIINSPAQNFITGYRAGETGTLFQLQWLTDF